MANEVEAETPKVEMATKDWTMRELVDTERRIEKAFHDQTVYVGDKIGTIEKAFHEQTVHVGERIRSIENAVNEQHRSLLEKMDVQTRWMVGLMLTMTVAIIVAVLFK